MNCKRCGHPADWHRHDDEKCLSTHLQPCAPEGCSTVERPTHDAPFRCLGYDCMGTGFPGGTPETRCGCPDFVKEDEITGHDLDNLVHMLGVSGKHKNGYRNYFIAGPADVPSLERLRAAGFVVKNDGYTGSGDPCYHATLAGAKKIGLSELPR